MNDDVVAEILLWLPAKSVLRCRAVCRSWRRITTSAYFVAAHSRRRPLQFLGYAGPNDESLPSGVFMVTSVPITAVPAVYDGDDTECRRFLRRTMHLGLCGSCDGLLLFDRAHISMFICNPATRQLVNLPPVSTDVDCRYRKSIHPAAFYFHRPSGEYRVLCYDQGTNYILSTGSGEPRRLGPVPDQQRSKCFSSCVTVGEMVGESVYWGRRLVDDRSQIMAFDTVSEKFRLVAPPPVEQADEGPMFDMDGTLAVAAMSTEPYLDVWIREDSAGDGERWVRRLRVELPQGYYSKEVKPYGLGDAIVDDAGVLLVTMSCRWGLLYDTKEKRMLSCSHRGRANPWNGAYRESLVWAKSFTPQLPYNAEPWLHFY